MFTSRAEYRLSLRADNADFRLTAMVGTTNSNSKGRDLGVVSEGRYQHMMQRQAAFTAAMKALKEFTASYSL